MWLDSALLRTADISSSKPCPSPVPVQSAFETLKQKLYDRDRDIQAAAAGLRIGSKRRLKLGTLSDSEDTTDGAASGASVAEASGASAKGKGKGGGKKGGMRPKSLGSVCDLCRGVEAGKARRFCQSCVEGQWDGFLKARVQVFWRQDRKWYDGTVQDYDARTGKHRIWYDDGDWEFVRLSEQTLRFLTPVTLKSRAIDVLEEGGEDDEQEQEEEEHMQVDEAGGGEEGEEAAGKEGADATEKQGEDEDGEGEAEEEEKEEEEEEEEDNGKKRRKDDDEEEATMTDESVGTTASKGGAIKLKRIERLLQEEGNFRAAEGGERQRKQPERFG